MSTTSTRNLLAKAYCFDRQLLWDIQDGSAPTVNPDMLARLHEELQKRPIAELLQAAKELNIKLDKAYEC